MSEWAQGIRDSFDKNWREASFINIKTSEWVQGIRLSFYNNPLGHQFPSSQKNVPDEIKDEQKPESNVKPKRHQAPKIS